MSQLHYVITVQFNASNGMNVATSRGVIPRDGRTRAQLFEDIFADAIKQCGAPPVYTSVMFFSLEPNQRL
ncbi:hypothetical protein [Nocardia farcinica]|uniref:hypothetical protein n=1 Tax=Nocardia farcinica TaxID=37329 RepID=UPI002458F1DC|nr:hypothetical protein [Nocardia farcinica]